MTLAQLIESIKESAVSFSDQHPSISGGAITAATIVGGITSAWLGGQLIGSAHADLLLMKMGMHETVNTLREMGYTLQQAGDMQTAYACVKAAVGTFSVVAPLYSAYEMMCRAEPEQAYME